MTFTIEPMHREYSHTVSATRPWGYRPHIAGNLRIRNPKNRRAVKSSLERSQFLKGLLISLFLMCLLIASHDSAANEQPQTGEMHFMSKDGEKHLALHLESAVLFNIKGLHAQVQLTQSFSNESEHWVEGIYAFPLPQNSVVNAMKMIIGERVVKAEIRERGQAKKIYVQAKKAGKKTALIEQERPNLFTQSIANIAPGETVVITLEYLQPVKYDMGKLSIRFPMTITQRFNPGQRIPNAVSNSDDIIEHQAFKANIQGWATTQVADVSRISPPQTQKQNQISLSVHLDAGINLTRVSSPSHPLNVQINSNNTYQINTSNKNVAMDRDFELVWSPKEVGAPTAAVFHEEMDGESFVQIMLLPPHLEITQHSKNTENTLARELILIIDTSGSMQGQSIIQAKRSVALALQRLKPTDYFNVIEFNSIHHELFEQPQPAHTDAINQALSFVHNLQANGGTNMAPALHAALKNQSNQELLRQVVFVTDGAVGNEQGLFKLIHENLDSSRLFTVGIGSAPNSHFMEKAAQFGRGSFTHISSTQQVKERMGELFRKLESPVMSGINVSWPLGWTVEAYPAKTPDLYLGEPLLITAKAPLQMHGDEKVIINGELAGKKWSRAIQLPIPKTVYIQSMSDDDTRAIIPSYWAGFKIDHLLDQKTLGKDQESIRNEVLPLALKFQLISPYTSFIAVEEVLSRPEEAEVVLKAVANTKPAGQTSKRISYPKTATSAPLNLLMGFIALLLAVLASKYMPTHQQRP